MGTSNYETAVAGSARGGDDLFGRSSARRFGLTPLPRHDRRLLRHQRKHLHLAPHRRQVLDGKTLDRLPCSTDALHLTQMPLCHQDGVGDGGRGTGDGSWGAGNVRSVAGPETDGAFGGVWHRAWRGFLCCGVGGGRHNAEFDTRTAAGTSRATTLGLVMPAVTSVIHFDPDVFSGESVFVGTRAPLHN